MNQNNTIPREVIKWLDSLDLAYAVRNVRRDLANGFIVAEILSRYYPREVSIYSYYNGLNLLKKKDNWEQIAKLLSKKEFELTLQQYEPIYHAAPDAALEFLEQLYEFLTKKKLQNEKKPQIKRQEDIPSYAKPTAGYLSKDRELARIVDKDEKKMRTQLTILRHNDKVREEKQDSNIIEYLVLKRRAQLEEKLREEEEQLLERKRKYNIDQTSQPEVKEIQIKSYKSSTSKKSKEQQGQLMEAKGILENLQESSGSIIKKEFVDETIRKLKIDKKQSIIQQLFLRCDEIKYEREEDPNVLDTFLLHFQQEQQLEMITDQLNNNFLDFKKCFFLFLKPLEYSPVSSKTYLYILSFFKKIASLLCEIDPQTLQLMFENILLRELLNIIIKHPTKRETIVDVFYYFCATDSISRQHLIKKIKEYLNTDLQNYVAILSILVTQDYGEDNFDEELYHWFLHYSFQLLYSPSAFTRTNCLKIINEILYYNQQPILQKIDRLQRLVDDSWWEVNAQILIICANLLLFIAQAQSEEYQKSVNDSHNQSRHQNNKNNSSNPNNESQNNSKNMEEIQSIGSGDQNSIEEERAKQQEYLMQIIYQLFRSKVSQNILRIGLIYLAPVLNYYPQLCDRYLDILLEIYDTTRETVLMTDPLKGMEEGQVVNGYASFKYKLTQAPVIWNSVGIAQSLDKYTQQFEIQQFQRVHLEILIGCLYNPLEDRDAQTWVEIYENINVLIFDSLCDSDLCILASDILKKIFLFDSIQEVVLKVSFNLYSRTLQNIFHPDIEEACKDNLLEFFQFLISQNDMFKGYIFEIIKKFSEQHKEMFLKSNLIEFMNTLAMDRRNQMFNIEYLPQ